MYLIFLVTFKISHTKYLDELLNFVCASSIHFISFQTHLRKNIVRMSFHYINVVFGGVLSDSIYFFNDALRVFLEQSVDVKTLSHNLSVCLRPRSIAFRLSSLAERLNLNTIYLKIILQSKHLTILTYP